ncbi:hypothetical protein HS1genome_1654 [Sulfodiicoccus acidiphilus]|uniref:Glucuronate isomerase n=1 Tax=Sulfodiicoccus acidiphilus TaxID=1670455 RepID=A0A348B513_9CREN|nr:hypothetical protein [Sulfodiicoccus acidiphilus]BBD73265.1 hypothetical protein HS1genome_1654 [Sulfodiicoccus acidiphilus]GGT89499.1 hypothetical protein GCM10007116_04180 [Sulfodiicoccus acidiphilus]
MSSYTRLKEHVDSVQLYDVHNHLTPGRLAHASAKDVLLYHYISTEVRSLGGTREEPTLEDLGRSLKYIRNTSTSWALARILRDLYGVSSLNEGNLKDVLRLIDQAALDENRAREVLSKARVRRSLLTLSPGTQVPQVDQDLFSFALRADAVSVDLSRESLVKLADAHKISLEDVVELGELMRRELGRVSPKAVTLGLSHLSLGKGRGSRGGQLLRLLVEGRELRGEDLRELRGFALRELLDSCLESKIPVQLMVGVERPVPGASPPDYATIGRELDLTSLFSEYMDLRFDLMNANPELDHKLAVISKNFPNVNLDGYWWYSNYPSTVERVLKTRLEMLPYVKVGGFFSDAYVADWVYGKAVTAREVTARTLSRMVDDGWLSLDLAIEVASALLWENQSRMYG